METLVFGAGSLGSLVGGLLAREYDVTLVGREDHVTAVRESGLRLEDGTDDGALEGETPTTTRPTATTDGRNQEADLAIVAVKAFDTQAAADALATGSFDAVLSLQNGLGNEEQLANRLDVPVLAGTATYGALLRGPGRVACTGVGEITLGAREGGESALADRIGRALTAAGLETTVATDMPRRLWEKAAVNAGINAITALTATENGAVLEAPANDVARAATRETARVARACDVRVPNREALAAMERVAEHTAANTSSMRQDVLAGRRTEIDAINGYIVDRAGERGLEVPTNRTLTALVRAWERGQGLR
ncbi:ketopantoate reductase family protein [Halopiger xanaduensis]|uniref:2-dehydropantoate 2-reductase n=1 Tax=Halopiger xanaduensis (strain DSM 18323 / JCM 14033 / SH-6) TaxID=797210 RepID=F8D2Y8_HALXS|nr:ketopantoate reductase family protein [Halopiger xanaduensis]AEH36136.1 2-dehydropantoate 2-reductase [Halopiger xanaduensis SH-6]